jgi:hypothetical protein
VCLELRDAPRLHLEHLLRFLTDPLHFRFRLVSATTVRSLVKCHHAPTVASSIFEQNGHIRECSF